MARIELPVLAVRGSGPSPASGNGRHGAAVERTRDAYRGVPILQEPTWGTAIAAYFYLGGISSGAASLGSLASLLGGEDRRTLARTAQYVAFLTVLPCPPLLIVDLGRRSRFHHMLRIFKPSSPMNLGAWVLTAHGGLVCLNAGRSFAMERRVPVVSGLAKLPLLSAFDLLALPPALALGGYTGVLIGTTSVPLWFTSPLLGALFMASALSTGVAATSLAGMVLGREGAADHQIMARLERTLGCADLALLGGYLATSGRAATPLMRGTTGVLLAVAAATAALAALLAFSSLHTDNERGTARRGAATALTLAGGALLRSSIVLAGKASTRDREGTLAAMSPTRRAPGWGSGARRGSRPWRHIDARDRS